MRALLPSVLIVATWLAALVAPVAADEIDDAARLPVPKAIAALEALLAKAAGDDGAALRIRRHLGAVYVDSGQPYASLSYLEAAADASKSDADRLAYAGALLATAKSNIAERRMGRNVNPFLRDALIVAKQIGDADPQGLLARVLIQIEAHYLLGELEEAVGAWSVLNLEAQPKAARARVQELIARVRYAQGAWVEAAEAFAQAGNDLGAAAAWDAARQPEKSTPIYARVITANPTASGAMAQAVRGARYTGGHGALLEALADIPVPDGRAGLPLLHARAELLEAGGRAVEALPLLRDAQGRDKRDPRAVLSLARLLIVTAKPGDDEAWDQAADAYIEAIQRAPENRAAATGLSWVADRTYRTLWNAWRDARVTDRCVRVQQALVVATPDDAWAWANLGNTLRVLGRTEEALAAYAKALAANPFEPGVQSDRGLALGAAGRLTDALAAYERSLALDGGHLAGRQNAARSLWLAGKDDAAEAHLGAAVTTARAVGRGPGTYRHLLDRIWRTRQDPRLR